jgi:hypothetical protein
MSSPAANVEISNRQPELYRVAHWNRMRALAWDGDILYASRGYELLRAKFPTTVKSSADLTWQPVASFRPAAWRSITSALKLSARLFRDGLHALAVLPTQALVAAVPGAIIALHPGEGEFRITHRITRGTRPLHITAGPNGQVFWGEYFDNADRGEVHIYSSSDGGISWHVAYTFPQGCIRHVHNVVHDPWQNCLWVLTGDYGNECRILRASCDFSQVDVILQGNQQARAVALVPAENGLYFSSDTPLEHNFIYHLDREGNLSKCAELNSSSIYGCRVGESVFFSTMVEPSTVNTDQQVCIYGNPREQAIHAEAWHSQLSWKKDGWPMSFFQYGNAFLPDGNNTTQYLAVTTVAVKADDMVMSLYSLRS